MRWLRLVPLCAALVFASSGVAAARKVDSGIIIRVRPPVLALRELDGTRLRVAVNRATVITLNGRRVRLFRLHRGDVATVEHVGRNAIAVRATRP
ncbi:MAG TPA: hypothetical protein VNR59_02510 [Gaiellaceae bacterium]|jgi:hypothetical protein|nr:hypothetical protein [Gaiellaceae bacterium]